MQIQEASRGVHSALDTGQETAIRLLQLFALSLFLFPSNAVIRVIGANGYVASLVGLCALAIWVLSSGLGLHDPIAQRNPIRLAFGGLWVATLISYALMHRYQLDPTVKLAGDRWLIQLGMMTGVAFVAAEALRSVNDIRRVVRALALGSTLCGLIAILQFAAQVDLSPYLRSLPGFEINGLSSIGEPRNGLIRVAGTALHPIELGVAAGMVLPLLLWLARFDNGQRAAVRWSPSIVVLASSVLSVSRSAVVALVVGLGMLILLIPPADRVVAFMLAPLALVMIFVGVRGFFRTMYEFFVAGSTGRDTSVLSRTDDYAIVFKKLADSPYFGQGPGTYVPRNALEILDNQYLETAITLGVVGLIALIVFLLLPITMSLSVRRRSPSQEVRWLCAALAGSAAAGAACTYTFDSLSFPLFVGVQCLVAGLVGACWAQVSLTTARTNHKSLPSEEGAT